MSLRGQDWRDGDEIVLVEDGLGDPTIPRLTRQLRLPLRLRRYPSPPGGLWGHPVRNWVLDRRMCTGAWVLHLDDDDVWTPGALSTIREAVRSSDRPVIFRSDSHRADPPIGVVWNTKELVPGNVGTPSMAAPNDPDRLGRFALRHGGDFDYVRDTCGHYDSGPTFHPAVISIARPE